MKLILISISLLLAVAYPVAINNQLVLAQHNVSTFDTAQTRISGLEKALNRGDVKDIVPQIEAT